MGQLVIFISGIIGTVGFSIIFGVKAKHLVFAVLGGTIACGLYVLTGSLGAFVSSTIASFIATLYSEIIARIRKAPTVTFLTPSVIPLVPGGSLYYTVANILSKDYEAAQTYGLTTLDTCLGIAAGVLVASLFVSIFFNVRKTLKSKKKKNQTV